jgi:hypothetical protein
VALVLAASPPAAAEPDPRCRVLVVGPQASAIRLAGAFDVAIGGGALVSWRRSGAPAVLAAGVSGQTLSQRGGGRLAGELLVGTRLAGALVGVALGPVVAVEPLRSARMGAHGSVWLSVGVTPFVRVAAVSDQGASIELGVAVALPTLRW